MFKNYMEDVVDHILPEILNNYKDICKCERCSQDIKAITLNSLKPLYVVTEKGTVYTKVNELLVQFTTDVTVEIVKAIEIVLKNPRH